MTNAVGYRSKAPVLLHQDLQTVPELLHKAAASAFKEKQTAFFLDAESIIEKQ